MPQNQKRHAKYASFRVSSPNPPTRPPTSQTSHTRRPRLPNPPHIAVEPPAHDPLATGTPQRRMLIRLVKGVLQQPHVGALHGAKHGLQLRLTQAGGGLPPARGVYPPAAHVDDAHHPHARVGLVPVRGEPVVDGVEQADVAGEPDARRGVCLGAELEDVDCRGEEERELERAADRRERVGCGVVRGEDGDVQRVVLFLWL